MLTESLPVYRENANNGMMLCSDENKRGIAFKLICSRCLLKPRHTHCSLCTAVPFFHDGNENYTAVILKYPGISYYHIHVQP